MITTVELFTQKYEAQVDIGDGLVLTLLPEAKERLHEYLSIVLPEYVVCPPNPTFEQLLDIANQWQEDNPDKRMVEPQVHLPYAVPDEIKTMLKETAKAKGISMSQLMVQAIDEAYEKVVVRNEPLFDKDGE